MKKVEKLNDASLAEVSGGKPKIPGLIGAAGVCAFFVAAPVAVGLEVADLVCKKKANKNKENGNFEKACKFEKASGVLKKLFIATDAVAVAGVAVGGGLRLLDKHDIVELI